MEAQIVPAQLDPRPIEPAGSPAFPLALLAGGVAAFAGSIGYALFSLTGIMVGIVAIGIAWLIAKAMMTASGGVGGRPYQVAAVVLTYFACSFGELIRPIWDLVHKGAPMRLVVFSPVMVKFVLIGPLLEVRDGLNGILGLAILGVGMRAAWRMAAGGPGFGSSGGPRGTPFG